MIRDTHTQTHTHTHTPSHTHTHIHTPYITSYGTSPLKLLVERHMLIKKSNYLRGASVRLQCLSKEACLSREASFRKEHLSAYNAQRNEHAYQEEHLSERSNCSPAMLADRIMPTKRSIIPKGSSVRLPCFGSLRPKAKKTCRAGSAQMMQSV